ncbi:MAG: NADP-dependent malic enzyme [Patescibacteria group bacterium]
MKKDINKLALDLHKKLRGKLEICAKMQIKDREDLSLIYTPGVAAVSSHVAHNKNETNDYTMRGNLVAVISDGSAVLGLGNIGPEGALPVMEGKCVLFKHFAGIDAIPIVLSTQDPQKIIEAVLAIAPSLGGINLEDIKAPGCFIIEKTLREKLDIPVIHDDQWGASVVVLAALINALKITNREIMDTKIVVSGAGAAGSAIVKILHTKGAKNILVCDRDGIIFDLRPGNSSHKQELAQMTNSKQKKGTLKDAFVKADVFIGVSSPGLVSEDMVRSMNKQAIVFALANPTPEIMPDLAKKAGAYIIATGRSDYPNQVNNALAFPGIFRGALDHHVKKVTTEILMHVAENLSRLVANPTPEEIIPSIFDERVMKSVAQSIRDY